MTDRVSAIIVSYNTAAMTVRAIEGLIANGGDSLAEILVVDNASEDGSAAVIAERFPSVRLFALDINVGFGRAVNLAAASAVGDLLLLLNPDVEVHRNLLDPMIDVLRRHPEAGIVGGRTLNSRGDVDPSSCWGLPSLWSTISFGLGLSALFPRSTLFHPESLGSWDRDSEAEVGMVTGCLLMVPRPLWDRLEGFDERYFMYGEDVDLAFRVRKLGFRPRITPDAEIVHFVGSASTTGTKREMVLRAKVTIIDNYVRWPVIARRFLMLGVALRAAGHAMAARIRPGTGDPSWGVAWNTRRRWSGGYPPAGSWEASS